MAYVKHPQFPVFRRSEPPTTGDPKYRHTTLFAAWEVQCGNPQCAPIMYWRAAPCVQVVCTEAPAQWIVVATMAPGRPSGRNPRDVLSLQTFPSKEAAMAAAITAGLHHCPRCGETPP